MNPIRRGLRCGSVGQLHLRLMIIFLMQTHTLGIVVIGQFVVCQLVGLLLKQRRPVTEG